MKEIKSEQRLKQSVEGLGGRCFKLTFPGTAGAPDRLVVLPGGRLYLVEMKKIGGRLEASQEILFREFARLGVPVHVLYGHDGVDKFINDRKADI